MLTDPNHAQIECLSPEAFKGFIRDIAEAVCVVCGGEVTGVDYVGDELSIDKTKQAQFGKSYLVAIRGNESLPEDGGVWADFDPDGELFVESQRELPEDIFQALRVATSVSTNRGPSGANTAKGYLLGKVLLEQYPTDKVIERDWYDIDESLRYALQQLDPMFEFPTWEGRTIGHFLRQHEPHKGRAESSLTVMTYPTKGYNDDGLHCGYVTLEQLRLAKAVHGNAWALQDGLVLRLS